MMIVRQTLFACGLALALAACGTTNGKVRLTEDWPARAGDYEDVTTAWTRETTLRGIYQEALEVTATFKSPEWRAAYAEKLAANRGLIGAARDQHMNQAQAEAAGNYEIELMVTTWDRRENDLDRGAKSAWRVVMLDDAGNEIEPLEIVKDKRPTSIIRAEYPSFGEFATAYIVRFARTKPLLGPSIRKLELRMSSVRGGVSLVWDSN
ncbi:MAG: hypothetical protein H0T79_16395 [Deltaproteobacteria bacterium]|nr:hypothetical protein [Deltaproteobacteria bacterium]